MMCRFLLALFLIFSTFIVPVLAQDGSPLVSDSLKNTKREHHFFSHFIKKLTAVDSNYISPNRYSASAMMLGEKQYSFFSLRTKNRVGGDQELLFSPNSPFRVGPYFGYSVFFLGYTFDIGAIKSSFDRTNFSLSLYSRLIGVDFLYESGMKNYKIKSVSGFGDNVAKQVKNTPFSGMSTYMVNLHVYYIFNNKHFSYPAAYSQSTIQKRSSGSFILGFNYTKEKINFDYTKLPDVLLKDADGNNLYSDELKIGNVRYRDYSFSIGYGYNWAFHKNFLANLTFSPTIGYNLSEGEKFNAKEYLFDLEALNFDFISRASLVWNNSKYFAGFAVVAHTYSYKKPTFSIRNSLVTASIYAGLNFFKKKKYKNK
jgi:hypothetical protein